MWIANSLAELSITKQITTGFNYNAKTRKPTSTCHHGGELPRIITKVPLPDPWLHDSLLLRLLLKIFGEIFHLFSKFLSLLSSFTRNIFNPP